MSLTIEFAGITTLVWDRKARAATAYLVDLAKAGYHRHHATLTTTGGESVRCPDPDLALCVPGQPLELGVWNLAGCRLESAADAEPLSVDETRVDVTAPPDPASGSLRWLPDLGELCETRSLNPDPPLAAQFPFGVGRLFSAQSGYPPLRVVYEDNGRAVTPERYVRARIVLEVDAAKVELRLDAKRAFTFTGDHHVVISNACVCEPADEANGHFYAHYLVVDAKRRPRVRRLDTGAIRPRRMQPDDPELCVPAFMEI